MFFLMRMAFWLTVALVLLPSFGSQPSAKGPQLDTTEAAVAAGSAVADISHFCERQTEACVVGAQAAAVIGHRAQAGAKMVYEFISDKVQEKGETGSIGAPSGPVAAPKHVAGQQTLTSDDLGPGWRGSEPRKQTPPRRHQKNPA
jgi:hypothetical protein